MDPGSTAASAAPPPSSGPPPRRRLRPIVICLVIALLGCGGVVLLAPRSTSFPPLPSPNGYDQIMESAAKVSPVPGSLRDLAPARLADYVNANRPALDELRRKLDLPSAVPLEVGQDWYIRQSPNQINQKQAALALAAEATLRQRQGDYAGALQECLDLLKFSRATSRGGLNTHFMSGMACEAAAFQILGLFMDKLDPKELRRTLRQLDEIDGERESWREAARRNREWARKSYSLSERFAWWFDSVRPHSGPTADEKLEARYLKQLTDHRRFILRLAARTFALERGRDPKTVEELVPGFLHHLPVDPATGRAFTLPADAK